jgi:DnaJ-class molecular chaperone
MANSSLLIKVETLYSIIDELNYYQILRLKQDCIQSEITDAYKMQANFYHPKQFEEQSSDILDQVQYISLSIKEAYHSLKDIEGRLGYDAKLERGTLRINDTKLTRGLDRQTSNDPRKAATNEKAKKYWLLGLQAFEAKEYDNATMQIQFALQFEPTNETFLEWLEKSKEAAKKAPKKNNNPYKLRL